MLDPAAFADMIRTIDAALAELDEGVSYIQLHRYMPPAVFLLDRDQRGRRFAWCSEETIERIERVRVSPLAPAYYGIPIVRLAAA